jgi:hypothetical protein
MLKLVCRLRFVQPFTAIIFKRLTPQTELVSQIMTRGDGGLIEIPVLLVIGIVAAHSD